MSATRPMTTCDIDAASVPARIASPAERYSVDIIDNIGDAIDVIAREASGGAATPFQSRVWLDAWYGAFANGGDARPVIAVARALPSRTLAMVLPLVRRRDGGLTRIEAADFGVTDYNAPILGPAAPTDPRSARALWRAIRRALPRGDIISITKTPCDLAGRANPLALLAAAKPSQLAGNVIDIETPFEAFVRGFERKFRKELGREKRVFEAIPGARFEIVGDRDRADIVLRALERMQGERIRNLGRDYRLDEPEKADFYRRLVRDGLPRGEIILTALIIGDEIVAALLGVIEGKHYAMVRLAQAGPPWSHFSPGRLVIMETMRALHARGARRFDFTIGDYDYKRRLGVVAQPLVDVAAAASWRGLPHVANARLRAALRNSPTAAKLIARWRSLSVKALVRSPPRKPSHAAQDDE